MTVGSQIGRDSSVSSVSSSSALDGSLRGDVGDLALLGVESLSLGVGLQVLEHGYNLFDRFLWVSSIMMFEILADRVSAGSSSVSPERDDGFVLKDVLHVLDGLHEVETSASSCGFVSVLVVSSQVVHTA